jgi:predicted Zn-dependent peptidase
MHSLGVGEARRATLDNGLQLVVLPRPGSAFHSLVVAYHGGVADEAVPGAGVASLWAKQYLRNAPATWGIAYDQVVDLDTSKEAMRAAGSDLALTLDEFAYEREYRVFWPPEQFSTRLEAFEKHDGFPDALFERRLRAALFGGHPYGRWTTAAELHDVPPKAVNAFLDNIRSPTNGIAVVVGDLEPASAIEVLSSKLGRGSRPSETAAPALAAPPPLERAAVAPGHRIVVQNRPALDSARMEFRCALPRVGPDEWGSADLLAWAINNAFFGALRERAAISYGVSATVRVWRGGTAIVDVGGDLDPDRLPLALRAIRRWVEGSPTGLMDDEGLERARSDFARVFNLSLGTDADLANAVVSMWNLGWPIETLDRLPDQVLATRREDLARMLEHCQGNWVLGLLGDEARIRSALGGWSP